MKNYTILKTRMFISIWCNLCIILFSSKINWNVLIKNFAYTAEIGMDQQFGYFYLFDSVKLSNSIIDGQLHIGTLLKAMIMVIKLIIYWKCRNIWYGEWYIKWIFIWIDLTDIMICRNVLIADIEIAF